MHAPAEENELDRAGIAFKNHIARLLKTNMITIIFLLLNVSFLFFGYLILFSFLFFIFFLYEFTIDYC